MTFLVSIILSFAGGDDDTYTVTMAFHTMHCEACKEELTAALDAIPGRKSVSLGEKTAVVLVEEKAKFDLGRFKSAAPRDMKLSTVQIRVRGKVSESAGKIKIATRLAGQVVELVNPEKKDVLAELRKQMGGENKFFVEGVALESARIEIQSFEKTSYEDK